MKIKSIFGWTLVIIVNTGALFLFFKILSSGNLESAKTISDNKLFITQLKKSIDTVNDNCPEWDKSHSYALISAKMVADTVEWKYVIHQENYEIADNPKEAMYLYYRDSTIKKFPDDFKSDIINNRIYLRYKFIDTYTGNFLCELTYPPDTLKAIMNEKN